jgi:CRISPR-associated protein Cmr2
MSEQDSQTLIGAIAGCLIGTRLDVDRAAVEKLLNDALVKPPEHPSREDVNRLQAKIVQLLGKGNDQIDLIYGGATKIKGYVFEADRLPEIRGASALLDYVGIDEVTRICGEHQAHIIYAGGGSFLAVAPKGTGAKLAAQIEQAFTDQTQTALSVVVAETFHLIELRFGRVTFTDAGLVGWWLEEFQKAYRDPALRPQLENYYYEVDEKTPGARFYNRKTFGEVVTLLTTMYHRRRDERAANGETRYLPIIERLPHTTRCASSDHRPALIEADAYGTSTSVSEASARKLVVGLKVKRDEGRKAEHLAHQIGWELPKTITSWDTKWQAYLSGKGATTPYGKHPDARQADPAFDIQQIGAAGNGFIGMIYADGNNVGRELAKLKTPQAYADFSKKLEDAAQGAVFAALATHLLPITVSGDVIHPFEILTIGGDDLILIVPGTQALTIALTIGATFEEKLGLSEKRTRDDRYLPTTDFDAYTPKIGLSAGVVVAKDDAPIFFLRLLAEELLGSAKKKSRINPNAGGAVDFMVMKSITMVTDKIEGFRKEALDGEQCRLTARPYLWPELAGLIDTLRALIKAGVPRSQLYRLRAAMEPARDQGPLASTLEYLYTRTRQKPVPSQALYDHIEQAWHGAATSPPWMTDGAKRETIWADLVEIYDMVKETMNAEATDAKA